jgi:hypothetical protein
MDVSLYCVLLVACSSADRRMLLYVWRDKEGTASAIYFISPGYLCLHPALHASVLGLAVDVTGAPACPGQVRRDGGVWFAAVSIQRGTGWEPWPCEGLSKRSSNEGH